jgi:hypothetical protein
VGSTVTIWVDERDQVVPAPAAPPAAAAAGLAVGVLVVLGGWSVLFACWPALRHAIELVNHRRWAAEWSRVEPGWSGRGSRG